MENKGTSTQSTLTNAQDNSDAAWVPVNAYLAQLPTSQVTDPTQSILASPAVPKLVERAISMIPRLEMGEMYWRWRAVTEAELSKYCLSPNDGVATVHWTLSATVRTNLHGKHPTLSQCWKRLTV